MAFLSADCPRCKLKAVSLLVVGNSFFYRKSGNYRLQYSEVFCNCPSCKRSSIAVVRQRTPELTNNATEDQAIRRFDAMLWSTPNSFAGTPVSITDYGLLEGFVSTKDLSNLPIPDFLPHQIIQVFGEGNLCLDVGCFNAAGVMYRTAIDLATKTLIPAEGAPKNTRYSLGNRLTWLFEQSRLPKELATLAECIKQDGNDAAHDASLSVIDAKDLHEFTFELLRRLYTEPERLRLAEERRNARHSRV